MGGIIKKEKLPTDKRSKKGVSCDLYPYRAPRVYCGQQNAYLSYAPKVGGLDLSLALLFPPSRIFPMLIRRVFHHRPTTKLLFVG